MQVVTISATYGAGGSVIGPAVAERLGVPFVDRAIPSAVAAEIGCSLDEVLAHDDRTEHGLRRIFAGAARLPDVTLGGMDVCLPDPDRLVPEEEELVAQTERVIIEIAEREGGVILGRAGAVVLAGRSGALHVRLDGPKTRRVAQAMRMLGTDDERVALRVLERNDRARAAYVKHFYRVDPASPRLYHLVLDSTALPVETCVELITTAARARLAAA